MPSHRATDDATIGAITVDTPTLGPVAQTGFAKNPGTGASTACQTGRACSELVAPEGSTLDAYESADR